MAIWSILILNQYKKSHYEFDSVRKILRYIISIPIFECNFDGKNMLVFIDFLAFIISKCLLLCLKSLLPPTHIFIFPVAFYVSVTLLESMGYLWVFCIFF